MATSPLTPFSLVTHSRGSFLFREGEKITKLYVIQSGLVSVSIKRNNQNFEMYQLSTGQLLGESMLVQLDTHQATAMAINETKVYEIPLDAVQGAIESSSPLARQLMKALGEKLKVSSSEIKSYRLERDSTPLPPDQVTRIFGIIFHVARYQNQSKSTDCMIDWPKFKQYALRVFNEPPTRLEQALLILVKLKLATLEMTRDEKDPDAPEQLASFKIHKLQVVEDFFEFYQHYYFRGGNTQQFLKYDEKCSQVVAALVELTQNAKVDRTGICQVNYKQACDQLTQKLGSWFNAEYFSRLELKGLYPKRESSSTGGVLSLIRSEFESRLNCWKILNQIELWNSLGFVDLSEKSDLKATGPRPCPACQADTNDKQKFCPNCGYRLFAAAA